MTVDAPTTFYRQYVVWRQKFSLGNATWLYILFQACINRSRSCASETWIYERKSEQASSDLGSGSDEELLCQPGEEKGWL